MKVCQHFNFCKLTSLPRQASVFKHDIVIVHFNGKMLFSSVLTLRNASEAVLLCVRNITNLTLITVLVVNLAAHCVLTSCHQLALPSVPLYQKMQKKYLFNTVNLI